MRPTDPERIVSAHAPSEALGAVRRWVRDAARWAPFAMLIVAVALYQAGSPRIREPGKAKAPKKVVAVAHADSPEDRPRHPTDLAPYFEGRIPEYPGSHPVPVVGGLVANGVPMRVAIGETRDAPEQVLAFYSEEFTRQGLRPDARNWGDGLRMVGAVDDERGDVLTVTTVERADGVVELRMAMGDIASGQFEFAPPDDLPHVPGSGGFFTSTADVGRRRERTVQSVNWANRDDNVAFYRHALTAQGWLLDENLPPMPKDPEARAFRYRRQHGAGGEELLVTLQPLSRENGTSVFLAHTGPRPGSATR
jgi:hypothetical protein